MARKNRKYLVSYKRKGEGQVNVEVEADDMGCAICVALDECDDEPECLYARTATVARKQERYAKNAAAAAQHALAADVLNAMAARVTHDVHDVSLRDSGLLDGYLKAVAEAKLS